MEKSPFTPEFLDDKYQDLAGSKPVERATQKAREDGVSAYTREERIDVYLDRLESIFGKEGGENQRGFELIKYKLLDKYVTKPEDIPESYWKLQENIMREQGQLGDWQDASDKQKEEIKRQNSEGVLSDQKSSLEEWVDYFHKSDSNYISRELKYWIFRNIIKLQEFDKQKYEFPKRSKGTVKMFPDLNYEALGYIIDQIEKKYKGEKIEWEHDIQQDERKQFEEYLIKEDFAKLYSWAHELMNPIPEHLLHVTEGEWVKYDKGSNEEELVKTIRGKGTGWCTAGQSTARTQLSQGDFYVYYTLDDNKEAKIPRLAIRMEGDKIAEVRGIAYKQNIDEVIADTDILDKQLDVLPGKEKYLKCRKDMERLTHIDNALKKDPEAKLSKEDLTFLYEVDSSIEGFGYKEDPRVEEIRSQRNIKEDTCIMFECKQEQIATNIQEVDENTKAYIGPWSVGVYNKIKDFSNITHLYESFPDKKIFTYELKTDSSIQNSKQAKEKIELQGIWKNEYTEDLLDKTEYSKESKTYKLVQFTVGQLGFPQGATTDQIYAKAEELGLKLCSAEVGPQLRLSYSGKDWKLIAMKQISDRNGDPSVFYLDSGDSKLRLYARSAGPSLRWDPGSPFVFPAS